MLGAFTSVKTLTDVLGTLEYRSLGCWSNTQEHIIPSLECLDSVLDGDAATRSYPISKCHMAAKRRGYSVFAIQNGACYSSKNATFTYTVNGKSSNCTRGLGGLVAYDAYAILTQSKKNIYFCSFHKF